MVVVDILEDNSQKQLIFQILSSNQPLTARIIHNLLIKHHRLGSSYQSTYKVLNDLVKKRVLIKEHLRYKLNFKWLVKQKEKLDLLIANAGTNANQIFSSEGIKVLVLKNLKELDNCIQAHVLHLNKTIQAPRTYWKSPHCWWLVGYPIEEELVCQEYKENKMETSVLITRNSDYDESATKFYKDKDNDVILKPSADREVVQVIGDYVIRCELPQSIAKELDAIYRMHKDDEMLSRMLATIAFEERFELHVIKNSKLAKVYTDQIHRG